MLKSDLAQTDKHLTCPGNGAFLSPTSRTNPDLSGRDRPTSAGKLSQGKGARLSYKII